jgi:hypothetical protein
MTRPTARIVAFLAAFLTLCAGRSRAQGQNGRGVGKPRVSVSYYKTPPGRQDEWLALYKKYHRPLMDYEISKGVTLSSTLYACGAHAKGQPWDFAIINVSPPAEQGRSLDISRAELIRKLFPNLQDYVDGERKRWTLTIDHWDEEFVELDVNREPLSLYEPIDPPKK